MTRCARCDFTTDPNTETSEAEQAAEHAQSAGHWLCPCCGNSLAPTDPRMACEECLTAAREHLAGIVLLYDELPAHLGHVRSASFDDSPPVDDGHPLPGGDVLVLLAAGSEGLDEDALTTKDGDVGSVAFELHWWETQWRTDRNDEVDNRPMSVASVVHHAAGYLEVHARWAANNHAGFDQFAADMRRLHRTLEQATSRTDVHEVAEAECLECGADLVRKVRPRLSDEDRKDKLGTEHEGYQDGYTCSNRDCGRVYDRHPTGYDAYAIALRQHMHVNPQEWASAELLADWFGVSPGLLRVWKHRGIVETTTRSNMTLYRMRCQIPEHEAQSA